MKKTLSIVLALVFVVAAFAVVALTPDAAGNTDPYKLVSIKVTDAAGYSNPYLAVDNAGAFVENAAAYVVVEYNLNGADPDKYKALNVAVDAYETTVTSSTLDLSYAVATSKSQVKLGNGTIFPARTYGAAGAEYATISKIEWKSGDAKLVLTGSLDAGKLAVADRPAKGDVAKYYFAFIGVTKPATAGEVKAALKVAGTAFATSTDIADYYFAAAGADQATAAQKTLVVYDAAGVAKYTIIKVGAGNTSYRVFSGDAVKKTWAEISPKYLFDYVQNATIFESIGYTATPSDLDVAGGAVGFTYDAKLVYLGADNKLGTADDKDLTTAVNDANAFFGFSFATSNPAADKHFQDKTAGNPVIVTDTYAYVTATVETGDDVDIAPTGDFSANIVIVLAASAILAAAALAFVAKKARD